MAGLATCLLELVGYYTTASSRGFGVSHGMLAFWAACGLVGGPVFGVAGWLWWRGPKKLIGSGAAVLAAGFLSEAVVAYGWRLHYWSSAVLFGVLGILAIGLLGIKRNQHRAAARWLVLVLPAGLLAEFALELVYKQSF